MTLQAGSRPVPNCPDYVLIRKLGAGAFGEVWHARGPGGLDVALKFIPVDRNGLTRELRSLEAVKAIRHPNLVSLFGVWAKDNRLILAMELCDRTLQDRLAEAHHQEQPGIPLEELLSYMSDAANGLDALSAGQVQHRDVKPANLLLLNSGVKVADFGLAKVLEQTVASNSGAGTIAYTAPECFNETITQQSDQYSFGVTYYHLRTGHLLFQGNQAQLMYAHLHLDPDLSALPLADERTVLARALSKEPGKRWPNCRTFVNELIKAHQRAMETVERRRQDAARMHQLILANVEERNKERTEYFLRHGRIMPDLQSDGKPVNLLERADHWESCGDYEKAISDCTEHIRLFPTNSDGYYWRAEKWEKMNEYEKAVADYGEAIQLRPECPAAYQNLAQLLATCPDEDVRDGYRVIEMATRSNEIRIAEGDEIDAWDWEILAAAYAQAGRFEEAMHYQNKAVEDVTRYPFVNKEPFLQRLEYYKHKRPYRGKLR
ncbi:MAG: tetratricopeptide repeat protein [Gemmataceae bacterium]|nr:tetratricopeptide repeat protein [Gemmataceae bacterium]